MIKNKIIIKIMCLLLIIAAIAMPLTGCIGCSNGSAGSELTVSDGKVYDKYNNERSEIIILDSDMTDVSLIDGDEFVFNLAGALRAIPLFLFESIFGTGNTDNLAMSLGSGVTLEPSTVLTNTVSAFDALVSAAAPLAEGLKSFALVLLLGMWAINFVGIVINEKFTMEALLKGFMQFVCGALLVDNAGTIVSAFGGLGAESVNLLGSAGDAGLASSFGSLSSDIWTLCMSNVWTLNVGLDIKILDPFVLPSTFVFDFKSWMAVLLLIAPFYFQIKLAFKIVSVVLTRSLELYVRIALAPIPIAFASSNGFGPETIRYFRSTMACALQPALMMAGCVAIPHIVTALETVFNTGAGILPGILGLCAAYIVISTYFGETKQLAHSIIGG